MSKNYTVMELEAIKHLCKSVNLIANLPTDLIADTNVATNTTYSSYRIDAEMSALETDIQAYVDTALAGLNKLTKEVIDDKALVVKENVLYLYKDPSDMNNDYMQMMLINGVAIELGSTTCDFNSVYSKDEIDDRFALKIDLDVLTTSFNNLVASVEKKIDKDKIATVLDDTVTDEQVPSAKTMVEELDKKIDKDKIVTVLDDSVTNEQVASALLTKTELGKINDSLVDLDGKRGTIPMNATTITGDILQFALENAETWTEKIYATGVGITNIPTFSTISDWSYSKCIITKRHTQIWVELLGWSTGTRAINAYDNNQWSGWKELATMDKVDEKVDELFQSVSDGKTLVANAITGKGVSTATDATFATMATNIGKISGGYKEETVSYNNTSTTANRLTFTFSADISGVKQITPPSDISTHIVPETLGSMFTINGKKLTLYVNGVGTWKVTAIVKQ